MRTHVLLGVVALMAAAAAGARDKAVGDLPDASRAEALYEEGRFIRAAEIAGGAADCADCQALAAKAYASAALFSSNDAQVRAWSEEAASHAEAALALDPRHIEGRLQLAVALWLKSRNRGGFEAYLEGMPQRGRRLVEAAVADAPDEPWAYALLGAWHFEALRRGGEWAERMLGANLAAGAEAFHRARTLDPGDASIAVQVGLSYLALDARRFRDQGELALEDALAIPPQDAFDTAMQARARDALALLEADDMAGLEEAIARWFGG